MHSPSVSKANKIADTNIRIVDPMLLNVSSTLYTWTVHRSHRIQNPPTNSAGGTSAQLPCWSRLPKPSYGIAKSPINTPPQQQQKQKKNRECGVIPYLTQGPEQIWRSQIRKSPERLRVSKKFRIRSPKWIDFLYNTAVKIKSLPVILSLPNGDIAPQVMSMRLPATLHQVRPTSCIQSPFERAYKTDGKVLIKCLTHDHDD